MTERLRVRDKFTDKAHRPRPDAPVGAEARGPRRIAVYLASTPAAVTPAIRWSIDGGYTASDRPQRASPLRQRTSRVSPPVRDPECARLGLRLAEIVAERRIRLQPRERRRGEVAAGFDVACPVDVAHPAAFAERDPAAGQRGRLVAETPPRAAGPRRSRSRCGPMGTSRCGAAPLRRPGCRSACC